MKTFACVAALAFTCLLSTASAQRRGSINPAQVDPSSPDKCLWTESGKRDLYPVGSSWTAAECQEVECVRRDDNKLYVSKFGCNRLRTAPPCRITSIDESKSYPQCCPQIICP